MDGVERFQDLVTWQRVHELSLEIRKTAGHPPIASDYKFRGQLTHAADSAVRNVAEGFARYNPAEFARFLDVSRASATEVRACLRTASEAGWISDRDFEHLDALARRGLQALAKFQRYLRSEEAHRNAKRARYARRSRPSFSNDSNDSND